MVGPAPEPGSRWALPALLGALAFGGVLTVASWSEPEPEEREHRVERVMVVEHTTIDRELAVRERELALLDREVAQREAELALHTAELERHQAELARHVAELERHERARERSERESESQLREVERALRLAERLARQEERVERRVELAPADEGGAVFLLRASGQPVRVLESLAPVAPVGGI